MGKVMENGGEIYRHRFSANQKLVSLWIIIFLPSYSMSNKLLLVARHILTTDLQKCLQSGHCKLHEFIVTPSIVKKACTGSKNSQGT